MSSTEMPADEGFYWKIINCLGSTQQPDGPNGKNYRYGQYKGFSITQIDMDYWDFQQSTSFKERLSGWKIHLSVAHADVARATQIVADVYKIYGAAQFKVVMPRAAEGFSDRAIAGNQAGKMFTLQDRGEPNWPQIILAIEQRFKVARIRPGLPVIEDIAIPGSAYAYKRNDRDLDGNYVLAEEARKRNPANPANPYNHLDPLRDLKFIEQSINGRPAPVSHEVFRDSELSTQALTVDHTTGKEWVVFRYNSAQEVAERLAEFRRAGIDSAIPAKVRKDASPYIAMSVMDYNRAIGGRNLNPLVPR